MKKTLSILLLFSIILICGCSKPEPNEKISALSSSPLAIDRVISEKNIAKNEGNENKLNFDSYELIGIIYSKNTSQSEVIIRIRKDKSYTYKENEIIDGIIKLVKIESGSVLLADKNNSSNVKLLNLINEESNSVTSKPSTTQTTVKNYETPTQSSYIEDAFRDGYLRFKNSNK